MKFSASENSLIISSNDDYSNFEEPMEVTYSGEKTLLGVSSRYLNEMIPLIDSQFVVLDILTEEDVIMIYPLVDSNRVEDRKYFYVLMPMDLS